MDRARRVDPGNATDPRLRAAVQGFAAATMRLATIDAVTTELVRLRCASHHQCRT